MRSGVIRFLLCCFMVLAFQGISQGLVVSDSFDTAAAGVSLSGRITEVGGSTWMVQGGTAAVIGSDGAISSDGAAASQASIALRSPNRWQDMYISADVLVSSSDDYVGLAILPTTNCTDNWGSLGTPSLRLHPNGNWEIYGQTGGNIAGFTPDVYHTVQLQYHYINQKFIFYLDGNLIRDQWYPSTTFPNQPNAIGFRINNTASGLSKINNFSFRYTTDLASYPVVSRPSLFVTDQAGTADVIVSNGGEGTLDWTAVSDSSWLTLSPASGTGTTTMTLNYDENATVSRTGVITITGNGQTATISVVQVSDGKLVVSDSFDTGDAGDSLSGRLTEEGGSTWMVSGGTAAVIGSDGAVSSAGSVAGQATVALRSRNVYQEINLVADVLVSSSDDYVSLAYCPTNNGSDDWNNLGLPSLRLHPSGAWELYGLTGGTISGFTADVYHKVELQYHFINKNVKFYLDDVLIQDQYVWQSWTNWPEAVGFRINNTASGLSKIDNFKTIYTSDIPSFPVVSQTALSVPKESNSVEVIVSDGGQGTLEWTAVSDSGWLTVSPASGIDTGTLTITCSENTTYAVRNGIITITGNSQTATINVTQAGISKAPTSLSVNVAVDEGIFDSNVYMAEGGVGGVTDPNFWSGITSMLSDIGVKQVRLDHIWDYYGIVSRDASDNLQYDWTAFDAVIAQIVAAGAEPFLCLSYMPSALNSTSTIAPPTSWADWQAINQVLAAHMVSQWSLSGLYYEVWNEIDGSFWNGTEAEALELYRYAVTGVRAGDSSAKVGGFGCAGTLLLDDLLDFCEDESLPVDFLSWHFYLETFYHTYDRCGNSIRLVDGYLDNHNLTNVEMIMSEWNYTALVDAPNDAFYNAAYCGMIMDQFKANGLSKGHFFMAKDAANASDLFGSWGAITYSGKPKPSYNFFKAFSQLDGQRVNVTQPAEEVKAFAVQDGNTLRILFWNFDLEAPFGETRQVTLNLNLAGSTLAPGNYDRKMWLIDSTHSNVGYDANNPELELVQEDSVTLGSTQSWIFDIENGGVQLITLELSRLPGDANNDGAVDVGDLGILAANYGGTGKTWEQGDFNGDGAVDVGDLGILAANYGTGSSSAVDFDADYAKAFGTAVDEIETEETWPCASLGLPLVVGLLFVGLMLVKLEE